MADSNAQVRMFVLLREYANSQEVLTYEEVEKHTGWTRKTFVDTYYSKHYREFMVKCDGGYRVHSHFARIPPDDFIAHVKQSRTFFGKYRRVAYSRTITYEFLLPLTREDKLRQSLDELFYKDTLAQRYSEIESSVLQSAIPRNEGETNLSYQSRVLGTIGDFIGGYSISHVSGRYRAGELASQEQAASEQAKTGRKYIHDETTASVRFIIPCPSSKSEIDPQSVDLDELELWADDIRVVRPLFFHFFVDAIIRTIRGEDEIWLIESSNARRLFVFEKEQDR